MIIEFILNHGHEIFSRFFFFGLIVFFLTGVLII